MQGRSNLGGLAIAAIAICAVALLLPALASASPIATSSIIGGRAATIEEFPSLAYIQGMEGKNVFACTGTVVAPRVVLTAAHCVESVETGRLSRPGGYALSTGVADPGKAAPDNIFRVTATHVFPGFDPGVIHGDAAILILDRPTVAAPIAMAGAGDAALYGGGAEVRLAGWGLARAGAKEPPANLRTTTMQIKAPSQCRRKTSPFYSPYLPSAQACILSSDKTSGGCFGDSGGPTIGQRPDGTPVQLGITSTGGPACSTKVPTVVTRVDFVSSWVSEWIAATESGAPPPSVDPKAPLPPLLRQSAEEFAVFTMIDVMGRRFERARQLFGGCRKIGSRYRCQISWTQGRNIYLGTVTPFYVHRDETTAWDSHYKVEWAVLKCLEDERRSRRCPIHSKRG